MERENLLSLEQQAKLEELKERWETSFKDAREYRLFFQEAEEMSILDQLLDFLIEETFTTIE